MATDQPGNQTFIPFSYHLEFTTGHNKRLLIVTSVTTMAIACVICVLNSATMAAVWKFKEMKTGTNYLIFSLALTDLCLGVVLPVCAVNELAYGFSDKVCLACWTVKILSLSVSLNTVVAIALERFYAVVFPLHHKTSMSRKVVVGVILVIWLFQALLLLGNNLSHTPNSECYMLGLSNWLAVVYIVNLLVYFVICAVAYTKIYFEATKHFRMVHGVTFRKGHSFLRSMVAQGMKQLNMMTKSSTRSDSVESSTNTQATEITQAEVESPSTIDGNMGALHQFKNSSTPQDSNSGFPGEKVPLENCGSNAEPETIRKQEKPDKTPKSSGTKCTHCAGCAQIWLCRITFLVLVVMILCWLPFIVMMSVKACCWSEPSAFRHWWFEASVQIVYINSFLNPILYHWQCTGFRKAFNIMRAHLKSSLCGLFKTFKNSDR